MDRVEGHAATAADLRRRFDRDLHRDGRPRLHPKLEGSPFARAVLRLPEARDVGGKRAMATAAFPGAMSIVGFDVDGNSACVGSAWPCLSSSRRAGAVENAQVDPEQFTSRRLYSMLPAPALPGMILKAPWKLESVHAAEGVPPAVPAATAKAETNAAASSNERMSASLGQAIVSGREARSAHASGLEQRLHQRVERQHPRARAHFEQPLPTQRRQAPDWLTTKGRTDEAGASYRTLSRR